jgi:hypothetical protein
MIQLNYSLKLDINCPDTIVIPQPASATTVLIVNPRTQATDTTTLVVPQGLTKWSGIAYADNTGKLCRSKSSAWLVNLLSADSVNLLSSLSKV